MTNFMVTLSQMRRDADSDCSTNIRLITRRLSRTVQSKLVKAVEDILKRGLESNFDDLLQFPEKRQHQSLQILMSN